MERIALGLSFSTQVRMISMIGDKSKPVFRNKIEMTLSCCTLVDSKTFSWKNCADSN